MTKDQHLAPSPAATQLTAAAVFEGRPPRLPNRPVKLRYHYWLLLVVLISFGMLADALAKYDQGGFRYQSRTRTVVDASTTDRADDLVTELKFDWAGNVTEQKSLGDATVADRIITTHYDGANRTDWVTDSLGGRTDFTLRDDRGNVLTQTVKLNATDNAVTTSVYDALGRAKQVTDPEGGVAAREYDSRGLLRRERLKEGATPKMSSAFAVQTKDCGLSLC